MDPDSLGRLLAHACVFDADRLSRLAAAIDGPPHLRAWAAQELACWAREGTQIRAMVTLDPRVPGDAAAVVREAGEWARRERARVRAINLALAALALAVLGLLTWQLGLFRAKQVLAVEQTGLQTEVEALRRRADQLEQLLRDMDRNTTQSLEWHAEALQEARSPAVTR